MTRIEEIWAFTSVDPKDNVEGIIGLPTRDGWMPLVAADVDRIRSLRPHAVEIARASGRPVFLKHFRTMALAEEIKP